jgi:mannose-1-phosphate guanylyltransferase
MNTSAPQHFNTFVAIMAGGVGSRFWPASREARPKQFLDILGVGKSLLRLTFERFLKLCPVENIFIVTNAGYRDLVLEQLPELTPNQVLCEPSRNNTAPCVAYAALKLENLNPDANIVVAPSDHVILKEDVFLQKIGAALNFTAQNDAICTLGIRPTRPDTGYGYIKFTVRDLAFGVQEMPSPVLEFREKPDFDTAVSYLAGGDYLWNAGIFVFSAKAVLKAFQTYAKEGIFDILAAGAALYNTAQEQDFIDKNYPLTQRISIDYAIMEKAPNVFTLSADIGWSDLGTWASLHAESPKDAANNVVHADKTVLENVENCLVRAPEGKLVVLRDLDDFIVVDENNVLLVYPKSKEQEIKNVTKQLGEQGLNDYL